MPKLKSKLPEGFSNGLEELAAELLDSPKDLRHAIVTFKVATITTDVLTGVREATISIRDFEPVLDGGNLETVKEIFKKAFTKRTSKYKLTIVDNSGNKQRP